MSEFGEPVWGPTGREVFERTYSRTKADGSQESWLDTVTRVVDGNLSLVPAAHVLPGEREALIDAIYHMRILPAGRHLWTSGVPGRQFVRNCHRAGWTSRLATHFGFMFDELMKGGGVGANYSRDYLALTEPVRTAVALRVSCDPLHPDVDEVQPDPGPEGDIVYVVDDSREGWVGAVEFLTDVAAGRVVSAPRVTVTVDVSKVRRRGAPLRGFGGTASGPGPLVEALRRMVAVLDGAVGRQLSGMEAMRIDHALAQCVVAGNIRRSARMSIMHWADPDIFEFVRCKADHVEHWTTNISVEVDDRFFVALEVGDPLAVAVWEAVTEGMALNGEPGFFNSSAASAGELGDVRCTNPCGEIALEPWESCNLGHVNLARLPLVADRERAEVLWPFVLMARFLVRATCVELLNPLQAEVEARNRRIGVGILGFQEWLVSNGVRYSEAATDPRVRRSLELFRSAVVRAASDYAAELGIPCPVKFTTVAPTGTVAKLAGVSEGIHPIFSRYFVRRIRYGNGDPRLAELIAKGYATEPCIYNPGTTVVLFYSRDAILDVGDPALVEQADELTVAEKLAVQAMVQRHYADNAVSYTVNLAEGVDVGELRAALRAFLPSLKGTTVFPANSRPQSPYTAISREEFEAAATREVGQAVDDCAAGACPVR